ncbi:hypothetical protein V6N12_020966 [Hibiscus sabdariffa]|uniref:Uncharacterized protein n=1 Tax=Hibiscus sabdariffa TaxID=183260 RepID=A0ABR2CZQ4_9ROSI
MPPVRVCTGLRRQRIPSSRLSEQRNYPLTAGFGDMAMPGVWWCPSWAETTMISKPRHAAKMAVATALLQKPYLQFGKHQETVDLI